MQPEKSLRPKLLWGSAALMLGILTQSVLAKPAVNMPCKPLDLDFSKGAAQWKPLPLSKLKTDTVYQVSEVDGRTVLTASADNAASVFLAMPKPPLQNVAALDWQWKTERLIPDADNRNPKKEDAPLRVILAFDGDRKSLPAADQKQMGRARIISGRDMPYAVLMYIWSDGVPPETVISSAHSTRVKMLVVASGSGGLGQWQTVSRDVAADYRRAFHETPGPLIGVGVMTDTDNTGAKSVGQYANIRLGCAAQ